MTGRALRSMNLVVRMNLHGLTQLKDVLRSDHSRKNLKSIEGLESETNRSLVVQTTNDVPETALSLKLRETVSDVCRNMYRYTKL